MIELPYVLKDLKLYYKINIKICIKNVIKN